MPTWPSPRSEQLGTPNPPRNPFHAGQVFRGFPIHAFATACQVARSPVRIRPTRSALESFYFQASNGSVALPVAGYDYNSDWTPLLAGLSPARMAASLPAPDPYKRDYRIRVPPPLLDMTTTATGLLCWRDFHPLEWQLASLHQIRTSGIPAYGSHLGCVTAKRACGQGWRMCGLGSQSFASRVILSH